MNYEDLVAERVALKAQEANVKARLAEIDDEIRAAVEAGRLASKTVFGDLVLSVRPGNARIDEEALAAEYPEDWFGELYVSKVNTKRVRELLPVEEVAKFEKRGTPVVSVKELS